MSRSILDYFRSKVIAQQGQNPLSETLTTDGSNSDSEVGEEGLIDNETESGSETPVTITNESGINNDSDGNECQSQGINEETEATPSTTESIRVNADFIEAANWPDNLTVSLQQSTGELCREVAPETFHDSDPVEFNSNGEPSYPNVNFVSNSESSDILQVAISRSRIIKDHEKYELITSSQSNLRSTDFDTVYFTVSGGRKRKQITFQSRWLQDYKWLRYGLENSQGGWCLPCILFLTDSEKTHLGAFVCTPFKNYNKSKELMERHAKHAYHLRAVDHAFEFTRRWANPESRIDSQLIDKSSKNFKFNTEVLPTIAETVLLCAKQRISLQGHNQDKVNFTQEPLRNEGNFIAILRLLAKNNKALSEHLILGPKNAKYTSKTVQNEILEIAADQIRAFYRTCIQKCPHFSLIADEATSHGKEILSVCLRFLEIDNENFRVKPIKHEVLLDFHFLQRITGKSIADGILQVLQKHEIDVKNCRGQAYDTTASMSSSNSGVQAHIKNNAPDAEFQGCCLHSLNLVICHSSKVQAVKNMIDNCHQAFLYFHNSPKRQRFLEHIIQRLCPSARKSKINGLCKTRWVERHNTFTTILELYPYLIKTWEHICSPADDDNEIYPDGNTWNWDSESRSTANGLKHIFTSFEHVVAFLLSKELLEPIKPIAECLQGRLQEIYFGFKKVDEVKEHYKQLRENVNAEHNRIYHKALNLCRDISSSESMPRVIRGRQTRPNPTVSSPTDYWRVTITIPLLDSIISELEARFSVDTRAHYELCALVPTVITTKDEHQLCTILKSKWSHLLPAEDDLDSELARWKAHCNKFHATLKEKSITHLLSEDADPIFFPNIRELLCILVILPIGSTEAERTFSCLRQIHLWLRTTMTDERLGNLGVLAMQGFSFQLNVEQICKEFATKHSRKMCTSSVLYD